MVVLGQKVLMATGNPGMYLFHRLTQKCRQTFFPWCFFVTRPTGWKYYSNDKFVLNYLLILLIPMLLHNLNFSFLWKRFKLKC